MRGVDCLRDPVADYKSNMRIRLNMIEPFHFPSSGVLLDPEGIGAGKIGLGAVSLSSGSEEPSSYW